MSVKNNSERLPVYQTFVDAISVLSLPMSASELHGLMCGYLCAGAVADGEAYLQALAATKNEDDEHAAALAMFNVYSFSQQQFANFDFEFKLLLPDDREPLIERAQAFGEWCEGFTQGISIVGVTEDQLDEDEAQEALQHLQEFAQLDYDSLNVDEEDERALMEVTEYARMAVLRLYGDLLANDGEGSSSSVMH